MISCIALAIYFFQHEAHAISITFNGNTDSPAQGQRKREKRGSLMVQTEPDSGQSDHEGEYPGFLGGTQDS